MLQICPSQLIQSTIFTWLILYILITCQEWIKYFYLKVRLLYTSVNILFFSESIFIDAMLMIDSGVFGDTLRIDCG